MIKVIEIDNVKGISNKRFELDIYPNNPSLLVAPNGFGKSSFATAFNSMNRNRINLNEDDYHEENEENIPTISYFNDLLKKNDVIDTPTWRQIQRLGDIRNLCDHNKERDPTEKEVQELIDGVENFTKTLF